MVISFLQRSALFFILMSCIVVALQSNDNVVSDKSRHNQAKKNPMFSPSNSENPRPKRQVKRQQGFFATLGQLFYEQLNETTSAYRQISKLVSNNFADSNEVTDPVTEKTEPNGTTTEAPYRISREDFFGIIRRNIRGLTKLFRVEWRDAMNQSTYSIREYRKQFGNELGKIIG